MCQPNDEAELLLSLNASEVETMHPRLGEFREVCVRFDPDGAFRNEFVREHLFASKPETVESDDI